MTENEKRLDKIIVELVPRMFDKTDPCAIESEQYMERAMRYKRTYLRKEKIRRVLEKIK